MESEKVKEIKKALSCSAGDFYAEPIDCKLCKFSDKGIYSKCKGWKLAKDSLTLINELESENERLVESCKNCHYIKDLEITNGHTKELKDRIAELEKVYDRQVRIINDLNIEVVKEREKLPKFAEKLKEKAQQHYEDDTLRDFTLEYGDVEDTLKECISQNN